MEVALARHGTHIPQKEGRDGCCGRCSVIFVGTEGAAQGRMWWKVESNIQNQTKHDHVIPPVKPTLRARVGLGSLSPNPCPCPQTPVGCARTGLQTRDIP